MLSFLTILKNELLSYFVPEKWNIKSPVNALNAANAADICIVLTLTLQQILR